MNKLYSVLFFLVFFGLVIPCASAANITSFIPQTVEMDMGLSQNVEILKDKVSDGTLGFNAMVSVLDSEVVEINTGSLLPVANFSTNVSEGYAPLVVQFNDSSKNATSVSWNFGDETANSNELNPVHVFADPGTYTVNLTASNANGTNSKLTTINVTNPVDWKYSPQEPVCGDTINMSGSASPGEKLNVLVTFEKNVSVSEGEYEYSLQNVSIVNDLGNLFTVEAKGVNNLNVRAKKVIWLTKSANASEDTAIVSRSNIPTGTYQIRIDGDAKEGVSEVNLKITASQTIQADSNGNFSYSYNTTAVPPGNFEVNVGNITKVITLGSKEEPVLPVANFSTNVSEGYAPLVVQFNDSSKNATSVSWNFGDETANSNELNPVHVFADPGTYTVNLTASNANGTNSKLTTINVTNPVDWKYSPQEPVCGDTINMSGSASPGEKLNVLVTFEKNVSVSEGEYEYSLQNVSIVNDLGNLFTVEAKGVNNLNVRAKKVIWLTKSANASEDTAIVSRSNIPTGTYQIRIDGDAKEGVSEVNLKITASQTIQADSNGNFSYSYNTTAVPPGNFEVNVGNITKVITLGSKEEPVLPVANFSTNVSEGYAPLVVQFNDSSKNATSVSWNFGDETANSNELNPVHVFADPGTYTVNLTASNANGTNSKLTTINVTNPVDWKYSPQEPVCGDTINMSGSASPGEKLNVLVTFEKNVSVSEGEYEYSLQNVSIVNDLGNLFTVEAKGVNNLNVRAKKVIWLTKSANASEDTAIVSRSNIPTGTYQIRIDGDAKEGVSEVNLKITASQTIQADSNGNFSYSYNTTAVPPGNFEVNVGNITKVITLGSKEEPVLPVANFSTNVSEGYAPLVVQFTNLSSNAESVAWDFENDGVIDTDESNPIHEFTTPGNYTVNLTASNANGTSSKLDTITVTEKPEPVLPVANFSTNVSEGYAPLVVQFTNLSSNAESVAWDFENDGVIDTDESNPIHEFTTPGNYTVNLTASNANGTSSKLDTITVTEKPEPVLPVANFSTNVSEGYAPLVVQFTNLSSNAESVAWDFENDGVIDTDESNPIHEFTTPGNYTVNLTASNANGTSSKLDTITVTEKPEPVLPVANFSTNVSTNVSEGYAPLVVQFTNLSSNAESVAWDFENDGVIDTDESNPIHEFTTPGNYTVNLTASNANGTSSKLDTITVTEKPEPVLPVANFSTNVSEGYAPLVVQFTNLSSNAESVAWDFENDGVIDTDESNPIHEFTTPGNYTVNLTASNANGTSSKLDTITVTEKPEPVLPVANFSTNVSEGYAPLVVQFTNLSSNAESVAWDFENDGVIDTDESNPIHEFTTPGNYTVNLTASNANGTSSKLDTITVTEKPEPVLPVANFSTNVSEGYAPLVVQFDDSSKNVTGWHWDFGDEANSTEKNPTHIYTVAGNYNVNLTVSNEYGINSTSVIINVFENMPFPGYTNPPKDSDHDGFYEDINGDGNVDFDDVVAYYTNMYWMKSNVPVALFDYNNNNIIDFDDVVILYKIVMEG